MSFLTQLLGMPPGSTNSQAYSGLGNAGLAAYGLPPLFGGGAGGASETYSTGAIQNLDSGGTSNNTLLYVGAAAIAIFFLMRK